MAKNPQRPQMPTQQQHSTRRAENHFETHENRPNTEREPFIAKKRNLWIIGFLRFSDRDSPSPSCQHISRWKEEKKKISKKAWKNSARRDQIQCWPSVDTQRSTNSRRISHKQLCVGIVFSALILAWISLNVIDRRAEQRCIIHKTAAERPTKFTEASLLN